jgi:hypothetical protein
MGLCKKKDTGLPAPQALIEAEPQPCTITVQGVRKWVREDEDNMWADYIANKSPSGLT